jgi:transcriptional regulator with XRE-family HTH domain
MKHPPQVLRNYLRMHRKRSALTQRELAGLLGCEHGSKVSRYERGERVPGFATLLAYEIVFRTNGADLFRGVAEKLSRTIRDRASRLHKHLDAERSTPLVTQKMEFLVELIYPGVSKNRS